jgi:hypothetical protein
MLEHPQEFRDLLEPEGIHDIKSFDENKPKIVAALGLRYNLRVAGDNREYRGFGSTIRTAFSRDTSGTTQ